MLKQILEYLDVSDVSMEEGRLRVVPTCGARRGVKKWAPRSGSEEMNFLLGVERAREVEFIRQVGVLAAGGHRAAAGR